ncbi:MAG: exosortase system-associated protein, TIGR04073 family [Candidatus Omnitrophica bacterium]|nr:exosortase system-associated protein, TIGR04073 family [Candidatus Omnitrophota bacterium]
MKKTCFCLLVLCLLAGKASGQQDSGEEKEAPRATLVDTADPHYDKTPINKLARGAINIATCWEEIPADVFRVSKEKNDIAAYTLGVAEGTTTALIRALSGVFDVVTFILPPYNKPLMQPEYASESLEEGYYEIDPLDLPKNP